MYSFHYLFQILGVQFKNTMFLKFAEFITGFSTKVIELNIMVMFTRFLNKNDY